MMSLRTELIALSKHEAIVRALPERPSLMREAAAELGADAPELLIVALERLGLETAGSGISVPRLTDELLTILSGRRRPHASEASDGTPRCRSSRQPVAAIAIASAAVSSAPNRCRRSPRSMPRASTVSSKQTFS